MMIINCGFSGEGGEEENFSDGSSDTTSNDSDSSEGSGSQTSDNSNNEINSNEEGESNTETSNFDEPNANRKKRNARLNQARDFENKEDIKKLKQKFDAPSMNEEVHVLKKRQVSFKKRKVNAAAKKPTKLKRSNAANSRLGLSVLLYPDEDNYGDSVLNNFVGFKVLVHSPFDFAEVAAKGFIVDKNVESFIAGMYLNKYLVFKNFIYTHLI